MNLAPQPHGRRVEDFEVFVHLTADALHKGGQTVKGDDGKDYPARLWVKGWATTEHKDLQGETILTSGLKTQYLLARGWFDDDHDQTTAGGLGRVTVARVGKKDGKSGLYIEGYLYGKFKKARDIYALLQAVDAAGDSADGMIGLSIKGPVVARDSKDRTTVAEAIPMSIAITRHPVNTHTDLGVLVKSLTGLQKSLDAGHPVPSVDGGGSGAALLRQDIAGRDSGRKRRKGPMKLTAKDFLVKKGITAPDSLTDPLAKAAGWDPDKEYEDDDEEDTEKSLATLERQIQALAVVGEHLSKGLDVELLNPEAQQGYDVLAKSAVDAMNDTRDTIAELVRINTAQSEVIKSFGDRMDTLAANQDQINKALRIPAAPKAVAAGEVVDSPTEGNKPKTADRQETLDQIQKSAEAAVRSGQRELAGELSKLYTAVNAGASLTESQVTKLAEIEAAASKK